MVDTGNEPWKIVGPFVRDNIIWILGLLPVVIASVETLGISGGNIQIIAYIFQDVSLASVVATAVIPFMPVAIFALCAHGLLLWMKHPDRRSKPYKDPVIIATSLPMVLLWLLMPIAVAFAIIIAAAATYNDKRKEENRLKLRYGVDARESKSKVAIELTPVFPSLLLAMVIMILVAFSDVTFVPKELIALKGKKPVVAQVLLSDKEWTKYLESNAQERQVRIAHTSDVESRVPCYGRLDILFDSVENRLFRFPPLKGSTIKCPETQSLGRLGGLA